MWFWLALFASIFWGFTYVVNQYLLESLDTLVIIFLSSLCICGILGIYFLCAQQGWGMFTKVVENYKVMLALLAYSIAYLVATILILRSMTLANASLAAVVESAYPIFTILFAYFLLHEKQFNWGSLGGTGLIIVGLIIVQYSLA